MLPFMIQNRCLFMRYKGRWFNLKLESTSRGGGVRGYYRFFKGLAHCIKGRHSYGTVFRFRDLSSSVECAYCRKEKQ